MSTPKDLTFTGLLSTFVLATLCSEVKVMPVCKPAEPSQQLLVSGLWLMIFKNCPTLLGAEQSLLKEQMF